MRWFIFLNFVYFILSSFVWPTHYIPDILITIFGCTLYVSYFVIKKVKISINSISILIIVTFSIYFIYNVFLGALTPPLKYLPAVLLCLLDIEIKKKLLVYITQWYGILIMGSIAVYLLLFFMDLPPFGIINHYIYLPYENYIIYLKPTDIIDQIRFEAFYFEPGHCAMDGSMLLFANRYSLKRNPWLIPILISVLLTLSLAGYVLLIIGILLINIRKTKVILSSILGCVLIFYFVSYLWNGGENPVNELIIDRLEYNSGNGIKGNNRAYMDTERYFKNSIKNGDIWFGLGIEKFNELFNHSIAGAGYKIFLLQYGLIGMMLLFLLFGGFSLTATKANRFFAQSFLLFIFIAFLQRTYTFWFSWQLPFICSIVMNNNNRILPKYRQYKRNQRNRLTSKR